jgi:hypothetical protein
MAQQFRALDDTHRAFIREQRIFFVASAARDSHVNISPRSTDSFRVLGPCDAIYLDRTGSGNETAAHARAGGRVTIMFCAFAGAPAILRLYGRADIHLPHSPRFTELLAQHFASAAPLGTRQIVQLHIDTVRKSCGFGVPLFDYRSERDALDRWCTRKGEAGLATYRQEKNRRSIDGLLTGVEELLF